MGFFLRKSKSKSKSKSKIKASPDVVSEVAPVTNDPSLTNIDNASSGSAPDATFSEDPSTSCSALDSWTQESMETPRVTNSTCPSRLSVVEGKELLELEEAEATPGPKIELKVDYDANPTLLYKFIEYRDWNEAWERCSVAPEDARTWVIRYEDYKDSDECSESDYETKVIRWKMLPIHVAIVFNAPVKLVTALLKAYPEAIRETDDRKMLPIHLACRNLTNLNVAQFLIIKDSGTLTMTDYKGRTVLAILKEYREKNEKKIDRDSKEELKNRDVLIKMISKKLGIVETTQERSGSCSDSEYSTDKGSDSFEESLGEDDKSTIDSFESKNGSGDSTCTDKEHFDSAEATFSASKSKSHESSIAEMTSAESQKSILKNPRAKSIAEKSIEHAMQSRNDDFNSLLGADDYNIIPKDQAGKNYIKRNKKAKKPANEADYDTQPSVLIKLIEKKMWKQAITRCVDFPAEASIWMCRLQKVKGENDVKKEVRWKILPIHSAIVLHSPVELIESLVDAYPQGLRKGDDRNMLPLHMAFRLGASPETTAVLVDAYPDALKKRDSKGHTPLHILKAYRRKYKKERASGERKNSGTFMDKNRKQLIRFYLGGRKYGSDDDATLAPFDSDDDDESNISGDSTIFFEDDDEDDEYDQLFYKNMFTDLSSLAARGFSTIPGMVRDSLACRT